MLDTKHKLQGDSTRADTDAMKKQRRRMALAVLLLLLALAVIAVKDHDAWFGADEGQLVSDPEAAETTVPPSTSNTSQVPATTLPKRVRRPEVAVEEQPAPAPAIVSTSRKALPPLDIEVVAGDSRRLVHPSSSAVRIDMGEGETKASLGTTAIASNAAQHATMSQETAHALDRPIEPSYPVLARQMKVQGAVVLQALIGADGLIQDLHVLSGPAILASAAQEAVRQWHFKPYLEDGKPVETQAKITVNFTISTF